MLMTSTVERRPLVTLPYATLLGFTRYVDRTGPAKAAFVGGLRRRKEAKSGFNPHGPLVKALKADIAFHGGGRYVTEAVEAVNPRWRKLYSALLPGSLAYLETIEPGVQPAQVREAIAMLGTLPVKINPHFGLRYEDGRGEAVRLHLDEQPPSDEAVLATLHLMGRHMDQVLPHATPVLVDLRRGAVHRPDPAVKADQVERWLTGEAAAYAATWSAAA
jgi:hypothetical protein